MRNRPTRRHARGLEAPRKRNAGLLRNHMAKIARIPHRVLRSRGVSG
jgi:hypothetical protein